MTRCSFPEGGQERQTIGRFGILRYAIGAQASACARLS